MVTDGPCCPILSLFQPDLAQYLFCVLPEGRRRQGGGGAPAVGGGRRGGGVGGRPAGGGRQGGGGAPAVEEERRGDGGEISIGAGREREELSALACFLD